MKEQKLNEKIVESSLRNLSQDADIDVAFRDGLLNKLTDTIDIKFSDTIQNREAVVRGTKIKYLQAGQGQPLVILHGVAAIPNMYKKLVKQLQENFTVIVPTLPGHASIELDKEVRSTDTNTTVEKYAGFVDEMLDTLKIKEPVTLVGHAFGGAIGIKLASENPDIVKKLILIDSTGIPMKFSFFRDLKNVISSLWDYLKHAKSIPFDFIGWFFRNLTDNIFLMKNEYNLNLTDDIKRLKTETTIYWGENDTRVPLEIGKQIRGLIAKSDLKVIKGRNHNWLLDSPEGLEI